jgi:putative aldouronate transport system permease protein
MYGVVIAFKDFKFSEGILGSAWVGLKHFQYLFSMSDFYNIVRNTITINLWNLLFGFTAPIILALIMNEVYSLKFKKAVQLAVYFPHFLSWVVFGGIIINMLNPSQGMINMAIKALGGKPVHFLAQSKYFVGIVVITSIIKEAGWGTIVYLAALAGVDMDQYEAAVIDGANRWQKLIYITLPGISSTIIIMLILRVGYLLDVGFEQIYVLYNPSVYSVGDVISTYIYRMGLQNMQFSLTTAIGLFQGAINFALIFTTNTLAKRFSDVSIW